MLKAFLFGVTIAIAIGPIALLVVSTGMVHGLVAGARVALGVALADFTLAAVAFAMGEAATRVLAGLGTALPTLSAATLIGFGAWMTTKAIGIGAGPAPFADAPAAGPGAPIGTFGTLLLTLANPLTLIGFVAFALAGLPRMEMAGVVAHALAVFFGSLLIQLSLAATGAGLGLVLPPALIRGLNLASGLGIAAFGLYGLAAVLRPA